jgi:hypothetical protein
MAWNSAHIIQRTYEELAGQQDLSPANPIVNDRLSGLVTCLTVAHARNEGSILLCMNELREARNGLPSLCGRAECEMERFWAGRLLAKPTLGLGHLEEFWYYENYKALWALERALLSNMPIGRLVFLGSGPLPLTAIMAAGEPFIGGIVCVDHDETACVLSGQLIQALGLGHRITVHHISAQAFAFEPDDLVLCASLIAGKAELYDCLFRKGVVRFLVRDAEGAYCYLYEPSPLPNPAQFEGTGKTIPTPQCINTTRLFQRLGEVLAGVFFQQDAVDALQAG